MGEAAASSGQATGVYGRTFSPDGVGVRAANLDPSGGTDLLLEGGSQGLTDTRVTESGIDRASGGAETFSFGNSGGGTMSLEVDGVAVVTTATDQDTLGALGCATGLIPRRIGAAWVCSADADTTYSAGAGLDLAAGEFSIEPVSCAGGEAVTGFDGSGAVCSPTGGGGTSSVLAGVAQLTYYVAQSAVIPVPLVPPFATTPAVSIQVGPGSPVALANPDVQLTAIDPDGFEATLDLELQRVIEPPVSGAQSLLDVNGLPARLLASEEPPITVGRHRSMEPIGVHRSSSRRVWSSICHLPS